MNTDFDLEALSVGRVPVYLDTVGIQRLAMGGEERRGRFLDAVACGGTLLFSVANAVELARPEDDQAVVVPQIRSFLQRIGPQWLPLEMNFWAILERERRGAARRLGFSPRFLQEYCKKRKDTEPESNAAEAAFWSLELFVDWLQVHRQGLLDAKKELDQSFVRFVNAAKTWATDKFYADYPDIPFDDAAPVAFAATHFFRGLVALGKGHQLRRNDGIDLCHAMLACAYSQVGLLDRPWKRRVDALPQPNRLAKIFEPDELNKFVNTFEALVDALPRRS